MDLGKYLDKAIQASLEAGKAILEVYRSDFEVNYKADQSPLTLADRRSHDIIVNCLADSHIPILSEEGKDIPYGERKNWSKLWMIDPLDGTKEFIKRNGEFTVNIAMVFSGKPVLGVIFVPDKNLLYFASKDLGSYKLHIDSINHIRSLSLNAMIRHSVRLPILEKLSLQDSQGQPASSAEKHEAGTLVIVGSRSHADSNLDRFVEEERRKGKTVQFIPAGSSLKFCLVAEGRAALYPRLGPTMEWDTAAGQAIAECAGAQVLSYDRKEPLVYNKESLLNPWFVASM